MHFHKVSKTMPPLPSVHVHWLLILIYFTIDLADCAVPKKKSCVIQNGRADCSHLSLSEIPKDLPRNISILDMSHNRLLQISHLWFSPYPELMDVDVSHNSISKLDEKLCQMLPLLQTLNIEKNQIFDLKTQALSHCTNLVWLNMASNKLKLQGEPFAALKSLKYLDVSKNNLKSAQLSPKPQLPSLTYVGLGYNDISILKTGDFNFLNQSSLQVLNMSSVPLSLVEPGSFKNIASLHMLVLDGSKIGEPVLSEICSDLSETDIKVLSLKNMKVLSLNNATFARLQNTNLSTLDLSGNDMAKIDKGSFLSLPKLQTLRMSDNKIKQLKKDTFEGLTSLKMLNLTKALESKQTSLPVIEDFAFEHLGALETLILQGSAIGETTEHTFIGLTNLKNLDLSWTKYSLSRIVTNKTFASLVTSPLKKLNLIGTSTKQLDPGAFSALINLTTLHLEMNFIRQTIDGAEFEGLGQLEELYLFNNQKIALTSTSFIHVPNLKVLMLSKSLIGTTIDFDISPFKPLSKLSVLDLSNNNIANIRENLLEGLDNLKELYLQHNNLARLWKDANVGGPVLFLKGAPNLLTLQLDSNGFDEIPKKALDGLYNLTQLSLSSNLLNSIRESIFDDLLSLKVFKMQKNFITAVRPQVFQIPMTKLSLLVMDKNPFDCTCESILWFVTWLNTTNAIVPDLEEQYICNTPLSYFNKSIMEFDPLSCKDMTPFQTLYILSSTTVLLLMVTALVVRFHGWRIQFYWNILISRTLGLSDAKAEEGRAFEFDAYVIHAEQDANWVDRRILPLEPKQCRFCIEDRDSIPGMSQLESIVDNMKKSRKILFVVTNSLLKDSWCRRFTAHHALHQVIEDSRDSVVLVFVDDIHDYKLSRALLLRRGMLRPCCVLHWPIQRERVPAFHQELLIALGKTNHWPQ